jgi:hypothetical protein
MSGLILGLTVVVFPIPFVMAGAALYWGLSPLLGVAAFMLLCWGFVYFYMRPSRFELSPAAGLEIVWPLRREQFDATRIESVERVSGAEFRRRWGLGMRIGAGGLFGGFGLYKTRTQTFRFYVSRLDEFVIVHLRGGERPLMLTPESADAFVSSVERIAPKTH